MKYKAPATATLDTEAITADTTGVLKDQASARYKRADIENEKYELSKPRLHGLLSGMLTKEVDERIANYRNAVALYRMYTYVYFGIPLKTSNVTVYLLRHFYI